MKHGYLMTVTAGTTHISRVMSERCPVQLYVARRFHSLANGFQCHFDVFFSLSHLSAEIVEMSSVFLGDKEYLALAPIGYDVNSKWNSKWQRFVYVIQCEALESCFRIDARDRADSAQFDCFLVQSSPFYWVFSVTFIIGRQYWAKSIGKAALLILLVRVSLFSFNRSIFIAHLGEANWWFVSFHDEFIC